MVGDDGPALGEADLQRLRAVAAGCRLVFDLDGLGEHLKWHAARAVHVVFGIGRVAGFDIQVLHVAIGVGDAKGHMLGAPHQDARHAWQGSAYRLYAGCKQADGVPGARQDAVVQVRVIRHHSLA